MQAYKRRILGKNIEHGFIHRRGAEDAELRREKVI
jgi:hypothetical protein